jgi:hypothetical protein
MASFLRITCDFVLGLGAKQPRPKALTETDITIILAHLFLSTYVIYRIARFIWWFLKTVGRLIASVLAKTTHLGRKMAARAPQALPRVEFAPEDEIPPMQSIPNQQRVYTPPRPIMVPMDKKVTVPGDRP